MSKLSSVLGTIAWAIVWGAIAWALMGQTTNAFMFGFALSVLDGFIILALLVPFIGIGWYIGLLNWLVDILSTSLGVVCAPIILTIFTWMGMIGGVLIGILIVIGLLLWWYQS